MKTIQVSYTTNKGTWLADINLLIDGISENHPWDKRFFNYIKGVLNKRYEGVIDFEFEKFY